LIFRRISNPNPNYKECPGIFAHFHFEMSKDKKRIFLIDGNSLCYRAFYAIQSLSTSKGMPTNAIYGFIAMFRKVMKDYDPEYLAVVFDPKGPTKRHKEFADYKLQRKPMPDDLKAQMPRIKEVVAAYNVPVFELPGFEADDVIATLTEKSVRMGLEVVIVTGDKDSFQLIDDNVTVLSQHMKDAKVYDDKEVEAKFGVGPRKMTEFMALVGDTSDNVPGVAGVGPVTAAKLINEFGDIETLYSNLDKVKQESLRAKLESGKEMAFLSRSLVTLEKELPVDVKLDEVKMSSPDTVKLVSLFREFEFNKFLQEIVPREEPQRTGYKVVRGDGVKDLTEDIRKNKRFSFCLLRRSDGEKVAGVSFSISDGSSFYVVFGNGGFSFEDVRSVFSDNGILKIGYDIKKDLGYLAGKDVKFDGMWFDAMIADYLLEPSVPRRDIEAMVMRRLGVNITAPGAQGLSWDDKGQGTLDFSSQEVSDPKPAMEASDMLYRLYPALKDEMAARELDGLFERVEMPLVGVLSGMEREGVGIDLAYVKKMSSRMQEEIESVTRKIYDSAGEEFNINSPKQLQVILFEKLELSPVRKIKTGASTDEDVLSKLSDKHELPRLILEYRGLAKLKSTYYDAILEMTDRSSKKLHTKYNQAVTATGRLSSSEPNLQNIPIKTEMGREIRRAFVPGEKGKVFIAADYSQIELRILAHLSGDKSLKKAFEKDEDIHSYTASLIFEVPMDEVDAKMRSIAKTVNFGIAYGMSAFGLSKDIDIEISEADKFIKAYFERYSGVKKFLEDTIAEAREKGYVTTILKRRRYIPEINSSNAQTRGFAERAAINTPVQGSAADLIKMAMLECHKGFKGTEIKLILQVHDELIFTAPEKDKVKAAKKIKKLMENVMELKVPMKVDVEAGTNWMDLEEIDA
jgi:DNA polymerase-1